MSLYGVDRDARTFSVLFARMGRGTSVLAEHRKGDTIDVLGPLGNSFPKPGKSDTVVLVGGGVGMPPLRFFAAELLQRSTMSADRLRFYLGSRSSGGCIAPAGLAGLGVKPIWATDDGSRGFPGTVVDALENDLGENGMDTGRLLVCSCGPEPMLEAVADLCLRKDIRCHLALERPMPCGVGLCMGCVVETVDGSGYGKYKRVCCEGTIFDAREVKL